LGAQEEVSRAVYVPTFIANIPVSTDVKEAAEASEGLEIPQTLSIYCIGIEQF